MDEIIAKFEHLGTQVHVSRGEVLISAHESPGGVFLIKEGFVKNYSISVSGDRHLQVIHKEHELFPLIWALSGEHRDIYYEAMTNVRVQKVSLETFQEINHATTHHVAIMEQVLTLHRLLADRVENLLLKSVQKRVAYRVLALAERFGAPEDTNMIDLPLRHFEIAESINSVRETVSRELEALESSGVIEYTDAHMIHILDRARLKKLIA